MKQLFIEIEIANDRVEQAAFGLIYLANQIVLEGLPTTDRPQLEVTDEYKIRWTLNSG